MKTSTACLIAVLAVAVPGWADKRLDDAAAKAEKQVKEGHPEEAQKTMEKAASQAGSEGQVSLGQSSSGWERSMRPGGHDQGRRDRRRSRPEG
jgi:hypothetical protein